MGCSPAVESPPPPTPPDVHSIAQSFSQPVGRMNQNLVSSLESWFLKEGGILVVSSGVLIQLILPGVLGGLEEGSESEDPSNEEPASSDQEESPLPFQGKGWLRLTLPCPDINTSILTLQALFSTEGLHPILWGEASSCLWADIHLSLNGSLSFFLPSEKPLFLSDGWEGADGKWLNIEGELDFQGQSISGTYHLMIDAENQVQILWEQDAVRFIIQVPMIDFTQADLSINYFEELKKTSVVIKTEEGDWRCIFFEAICNGPNDERLNL